MPSAGVGRWWSISFGFLFILLTSHAHWPIPHAVGLALFKLGKLAPQGTCDSCNLQCSFANDT
eukprot:414907-Amphidinium_carterae.1